MVGRTLAHYLIRESVGRGGMGEVYRADDLRLSREVAIKVLTLEFQTDPDRTTRFEREAKILASLNHPNIVQIYDIGESDGIPFIAMEFVAGRALSQLIGSHRMAIGRFFDIAVPLAAAIAAAHKVGVLHRDIKPANIIVGANGLVKVLDFGIAKSTLAADAKEGSTTFVTAVDVLPGTVQYMSPEQLHGVPPDDRSDVFSLGIVLYEMLTGEHPFRSDSVAATISSILRDDPVSPAQRRSDIPLPVASLVLRCLAKDPQRRKQSAADLYNDLDDLRTVAAVPAVGWTPQRRGVVLLTLAAVAGAALGVAVTWLAMTPLRGTAGPAPALANPVQITFAAGVEDHPTWAPDVERLAYESEETGNWDIWVAQLGGGVPVNLTSNNPGADRFPSWSPNGQFIAFVSDRAAGSGLYIMSALGGNPRKLLDASTMPTGSPRVPSWSSDSADIGINIGAEGREDFRSVNVTSAEVKRLPLPRQVPNWKIDLHRSPNKHSLAYVQGLFNSFIPEVSRLWLVSSEGTPIALSDGQTKDRSPMFSNDERELLFLSARGGAMDLWQQRLDAGGRPDGASAQITVGLGLRSFATSRDGRKVAFSRGRQVSNIWRIPILTSRPATWADAEQITAEHSWIQFLDASPDGTRLVVGSDRTGNQDLWILPTRGGEFAQLTTHPAPEDAPEWSRDGTRVIFRCFRAGSQEVCSIPSEGGPTEQITTHPDEDTMPTASPDGAWVVFVSRRRGEYRDLWVSDRAGGSPREIVKNANFPMYAPDGRWLLYTNETDLRLWLLPTAGEGVAQPLSEGRAYLGKWSRDGKTVYYTPRDQAGDVWAVSVADRREYPVTDLKGRRGTLGWGLATDGRYVYFTWWENFGDVWVMDVARP